MKTKDLREKIIGSIWTRKILFKKKTHILKCILKTELHKPDERISENIFFEWMVFAIELLMAASIIKFKL